MKKQLYRTAAATVLGLSLAPGILAASTSNALAQGPSPSDTIVPRR